MMATSCRRGSDAPPPQASALSQYNLQFVRLWGTDLSSGGNLSGPDSIVRLDNGNIIVLDRFNNRIQQYAPNGRYLGEWGRTHDGDKFPFTLLTDITKDPANGDVVAAVINRITSADMEKFKSGLYSPDTFLRFSRDGTFKGDPSVITDLENSPTGETPFQNIMDSVFWNRNDLTPISLFGRIAVNSAAGGDMWEVLKGRLTRISPATGEHRHIELIQEDRSPDEFCGIETDREANIYLTSCMQRAEIYRAGIRNILKGRTTARLFIPSPENIIFKTGLDTRSDIFKRSPGGGFALYYLRGNAIYLYDARGALAREIKIKPVIHYAAGLEFDGAGGFYISDYVADAVLHLSPKGELISRIGTRRAAPGQFAGRAFNLFLTDPADGETARPAGVIGVAADGKGNVFASDAGNHRVQKFGPDGKFSATIPACAGQAAPCYPADLLFSNNSLYVSLYGARAVVRLDPSSGKLLASWKPSHPSPTAPCNLCGIGPGPDGSIYVTDGESIFKLSPELKPDPMWKKDSLKISFLTSPYDVATDRSGNFYVVGTQLPGILAVRSSVCRFTPQHVLESCFQINSLYHPRSIAVQGDNVFIANSGRDTIIQLTTEGTPVRQWGGEGRADGLFQNPLGIATTPGGDVFIADNGNERIQQFKVK